MFFAPEKDVGRFGFTPGQVVADFGSGTGQVALALSTLLGRDGTVIAVDLQEEPLTRLKNESLDTGHGNVEIVMGNVEEKEGSGLKEESVDGVVFSNILFQLHNKEGAVEEAKRILKHRGKAVVVDWQNKLPAREVENLFEQNGFRLDHKFDAGEHHYGLAFRK